MVNPRSKGSSGEREAIVLLTAWAKDVGYDLDLERNLEQVRKGGSDVNGVPGLEIEVKRVEGSAVPQWWAQVCKAAGATGNRPFLMHRKNRHKWSFRVQAEATAFDNQQFSLVMDLDFENGKRWFQFYIWGLKQFKEKQKAEE